MLGEGLTPGSSAIVAVVEHRWVAEVEKAMEEAGADAMTQALSADIAEQLEKDHQVAYTAISSQEGFAATRVAGGEDEVEGGFVEITDDSVKESRFVATKDGFVVLTVEADDEGVTASGMIAAAGEVTSEEQEES